MKKIILVAVMAVMGATSSFAQLSFGVKAGGNLTNYWGKDCEHGMKPSYHAGVFAEYKFSDQLAIAPEVLFTSEGGKMTDSYGDDDIKLSGDLTFNTNYINVPVLLKFYVTPAFSIDFGPQVGFNVYSKATGTASALGQSASETIDLKDNTKTCDFAVALGGTYNVTNNVFVQARYTMGMTKVFDGEDDVNNGNISLSLGYRF